MDWLHPWFGLDWIVHQIESQTHFQEITFFSNMHRHNQRVPVVRVFLLYVCEYAHCCFSMRLIKYFSFAVLKLAACRRSDGNGLDWMWVKM